MIKKSFAGVAFLGLVFIFVCTGNVEAQEQFFRFSDPVCVADQSDSMTADCEFDVESSSGVIIPESNIDWGFHDGDAAKGRSVSHTYTSPGDHVIYVSVDDGDGHAIVKSTRFLAVETSVSPPTDDGADSLPPRDDGADSLPPRDDGADSLPPRDDGADPLPPRGDGADPAHLPIDPPINVLTFEDLLAKILTFVFNIGIPIIILAIIWSGFLFVVARGNPEKLKKAKTAITWTMVGAALIIGARVLAEVIRSTINQLG